MRRLIFLPLLPLLAACSDENRTAGGATPDEARALEDAADMIDSRNLPAGAVPTGRAPASAEPAKPAPAATKPAAVASGKPAG